jgi:hypothetical protein
MGKTAKNEKIKLRATFFNNFGVAVGVAGYVLPLIVLIGKLPEIFWTSVAAATGDGPPYKVNWAALVAAAVGLLLATLIARRCRYRADEIIGQIED